MTVQRRRLILRGGALAALVFLVPACSGSARESAVDGVTPVYSERTGRLEALRSDSNGDGRMDTVAHMDGVELKYIEIDRDHDGNFDRWEYYVSAPGTAAAAQSPDGRSVLDHAEEAAGPDGQITRREFFADGLIARVEEDTTLDGKVDKWETYEKGVLRRMELDLTGQGRPTRRLLYGSSGDVERIEADDDGDGTFEKVSPVRQGSGG